MIPRLVLLALGKVVGFPSRVRLWTFNAACRRPREVQEALLRRILAAQADTAFGRDHRFRAVRSVADFRRHLPSPPTTTSSRTSSASAAASSTRC